jgi:hypothetical protein
LAFASIGDASECPVVSCFAELYSGSDLIQ